jgi:hypothetical protein
MSELLNIEEKKKHVYLRQALSAGAIMLSGQLIRRGIEGLYISVRGSRPPKNPQRKNATWTSALIWALATGATIGAIKTMMRPHILKTIDKLVDG